MNDVWDWWGHPHGIEGFLQNKIRKRKNADRYLPCEFIENTSSTGARAAYINTGIVLNSDDDVEIIFQSSESTGASPWLFGNRKSVYKGYAINIQESLVVATYGANNTVNGVALKDQAKHIVTVNGGIWSADGVPFLDKSSTTFKGDGNCLLFGITDTDGSIESRAFAGKIFGFKVWRGGSLFRNFIPVIDTVANVYGMFETIEGKFYGNAGAGAFTGGAVIERVEYTENTGNACIKLRVGMLDADTIIRGTWSASEFRQYNAIYCCRGEGNANTKTLFATSGGYRVDGESSATINNLPHVTGAEYSFELNGSKFSQDGTLIRSDLKQNDSTYGEDAVMFLFSTAAIDTPGKSYNLNGTISEFELCDGATHSHLIPIRIGTEYAMFDLVSWTVYRNEGTGEFSGGNVVPWNPFETQEAPRSAPMMANRISAPQSEQPAEFLCPFCGKKYTSQTWYNKHLLTHGGDENA